MTPTERDQLEKALVAHFGAGATLQGIAWLVGLAARIETCEQRIDELDRSATAMRAENG